MGGACLYEAEAACELSGVISKQHVPPKATFGNPASCTHGSFPIGLISNRARV